MEILSFKIKGKLAHFRKYYANNTAFSFTIPPRTTLMGIVAASMGWPKDSYYEDLASGKIRFGIRVLQPLKKSFHRLNFLRIGSAKEDFRGASSRQSEKPQTGPIQTPFEVVSAWNIGKGEVEYQIFISPQPGEETVFEEIKQHFLEKEPVFNISLGTANFNASLCDVIVFKEEQIVQKQNSEDYVLMHSALPVEIVEDLQFDKEEYKNYNFVEEDMMPGEFIKNNTREVKKMNRLLFSTTPNPLRVKLNSPYYRLDSKDGQINIQFMDL